MKAPITAVILTKNEEKNIEDCIKSVSFCDEILVIDDMSFDNTIAIAEKYEVKIIRREMVGDYAAQRNVALEHAKHDWLLYVDADERVVDGLKEEIQSAVQNTPNQAFYIKRRDWWWNHELKYGEVRKVRSKGLIRLIKKGAGTWEGKVHEEFKTAPPTATLQHFLDHYPHPSIKDFLQEINRYSSLRAEELLLQNVKVNIFSIIAYPFFKFILVYFLYLGFLDGPAGFGYAFLMSFHSFLARVKLYQYQNLTS